MAVVFNPAVIYDEGRFFMYERAAGQIRPFHCCIGMLESDDGVHFSHTKDTPVLTPGMCGSEYGSVQDPRVVKIENLYYMTFAFRPWAWSSNPTGLGVPESSQVEYPGFSGRDEDNQTRSGIAVSTDRVHWEVKEWVSPKDIDDRDVIMFPEKIRGKFAILRRPCAIVGTNTERKGKPASIKISYSKDLHTWSEPETVIEPVYKWEGDRIGGCAPPIRTGTGWLVLYHGVENAWPPTRRVIYRVGVMLLDLQDPAKVIARCPDFIMEPAEYYEKTGLYIPNVIFPTAAVVMGNMAYIYYGVCDTAIALATVPVEALMKCVERFSVS